MNASKEKGQTYNKNGEGHIQYQSTLRYVLKRNKFIGKEQGRGKGRERRPALREETSRDIKR